MDERMYDDKSYQLVQNAGKLHVVQGGRSWPLYGVQIDDEGAARVTPFQANLQHYGLDLDACREHVDQAMASARRL